MRYLIILLSIPLITVGQTIDTVEVIHHTMSYCKSVINYPQVYNLEDSSIEEKVNRLLRHKFGTNYEDISYWCKVEVQLHTKYKVYFNSTSLLSVEKNEYGEGFGEDGMFGGSVYATYNINPKTGELFKFEHIFVDSLGHILDKKIKKRIVKEGLGRLFRGARNGGDYYFTETAFVLVFWGTMPELPTWKYVMFEYDSISEFINPQGPLSIFRK